jgi:hypothetical protein
MDQPGALKWFYIATLDGNTVWQGSFGPATFRTVLAKILDHCFEGGASVVQPQRVIFDVVAVTLVHSPKEDLNVHA